MQQNEMEKLAFEYMQEGKQNFFNNKMETAALLTQNALHLFKSISDYRNCAVCLNLMGVIYGASGNETMAVDCYLEGLEYAVDYHYSNITCLFYNNIGSRYQELNEHERAITYFKKAAEELNNPECRNEERYGIWCLITYLNLAKSYGAGGEYEEAWKYQEISEGYLVGKAEAMYQYTCLINKCILCWNMDRKEYVYENLDKLIESGTRDENITDYVQDMKELCCLLMQMGEYDKWKQIISSFEGYTKEQKTVYSELILTEMWMNYYQAIGAMKMYIHLCVEHTALYQKQREIADKERAAAIDIKIQLKEKEAARRRAEKLSTIDPLTGIGNRYLLERDVADFIGKAKQKHCRIAVGLLDIDFFKQHNDTYGHIQGDKCLKQVADVLSEAVFGEGKVYRFGGDEFVLILKNGAQECVRKIANVIKEKLSVLQIENMNSSTGSIITISQGYATFYPNGKEDVDSLIEHADYALYHVKNHGRNNYHIIVE